MPGFGKAGDGLILLAYPALEAFQPLQHLGRLARPDFDPQ